MYVYISNLRNKGGKMETNEILKLFEEEKFEEFESLVNDMPKEALNSALLEVDKNELVDIFSKLPVEIAVSQFLMFDDNTKLYLVENIKDIDFIPFSKALLDIENVEDKIEKEVFNNILIRAQVDARHNKLLKIIDEIENKQFSSLKPILSELEPIDIAEIINDVDEEKVCLIFRLLPKDLASDVFVEMDNDTQKIHSR